MAKTKQKKAVKNTESNSGSFFRKNLFQLVVFCFSFLLYVNTIPNNYNLDDELVTRNHKFTSKGIEAIPEIFKSPYYSDNMGYAYEYRPMVHVSFAIEHQLFGDSPHVSHFVNALLYACLCLLLFVVLTLLFRAESIFIPFLAALLFAAHPVHTEVVASIKNRDEMLALFFSLASWYFILKYSEKKLALVIAGGSVFFLIALLSKISIFSFVIIIPLSLLFFQRLPLYKAIVILISLFIPAFFIINVMNPEFKLLLLVVIALAVYLVYAINLWLQKGRKGTTHLFSNCKIFLKEEVFPFNHRFFSQALYISLLLLLAVNIFILSKSGSHWGVIVSSGLCLLFSLRAQGIFKWLLLLAFQLSLSLLQYLVNEQLAFVIFLSWFFLALLLGKSETREEKLTFGSLLLIAIPMSFIQPVYPYRGYLFIIFLSLIPFFYYPAKKVSRYIWIFLVTVLSVGFLIDLFRKSNYPISIAPVTILYLLVANYPEKLKLKKSWLFILMFFSHLFFSFTTKVDYSNPFQAHLLKSKYSGTNNHTSETSSSAVQPLIKLPQTILPKTVSGNVNRPLNFIENPVAFKDPMPVKIASALDVMLRYLKLLVIPYPMSYYYGYKVIAPVKFSDAIVIASILIHLLLLLLAIYFLWQKELTPFFGILIYFISILQFTNIFQAVPGMMADRYLLGPSLGFCIITAWLLIRFLKLEKLSALSQMTSTSRYVIISVLLLYSGLTIARNRDWKNDITLFRNDIKHVDEAAQAHNLLALHLMADAMRLDSNKVRQQALREEALTHFKRAVEIYPGFFNATFDLGRTYLQMNQQDSALVYFQRALSIDSSYSETSVNIGEIFFYKGNYPDAITNFKRVVKQQPNSYKGYDKLSYVYYIMKEFDKALDVNRDAIRFMPGFKDPLINIGRTFQGMNEPDSARVYYEKVLLIEPNNALVRELIKQTEQR